MPNLEVALLMRARDQASPELAKVAQAAKQNSELLRRSTAAREQLGIRAENTIRREIQQTEAAYNRLARSGTLSAQAQARAHEAMTAKIKRLQVELNGIAVRQVGEQTRLHQRAAQAREQLGIRSENTIRREIQQTEAAYNRLSRSGTMSAQAQAQAYQAMTAKVKTLRAEMGQVEQQQRSMAQRARSAGGTALAIGAGVATAGYMLKQPMMDQREYDLALRHAVNVALADRGLDERRLGVNRMDDIVRRGYRTGGGTRDDALAAVNVLLGSGALGDDSTRAMNSANTMLPIIMRYATAGNAQSTDMATLATKIKQTWGVADAALPKFFEMQLQAGKLGGVESKDMARHLPAQLGLAKQAGFYGEKGFASLLAMNQAALLTAGSPDQAANNMLNMLGKLNAKETADDMKKLGFKDWAGHVARERGKGKDAAQVFLEAMDKVVGGDAAYRKNQQKLANTPAGSQEERQVLEAQQRILKGKVIGKVSSDMQELLAVLAVMDNQTKVRGMYNSILAADPNGKTGSGVDHQLVMESSFIKNQQGDNAVQAASNDFFAGPNAWWGDRKKDFADWASGNRSAASNVIGTGTVAQVLGSGLGGGLLLGRFLQGGGTGGPAPSLLSRFSTSAQGLWSRGAAALEGGMMTRLGLGAAPLAAMYGATQWAGDTSNDKGRTDTLKGMSDWLGQWFGKQAEFDARRNAQLEALGRKLEEPIKVEVTVVNGNVVASVNKVNQIMSGRF